MENHEQLDSLVRVLMILLFVFGTFASILFVYAMGWVIVIMGKLYKYVAERVSRKKSYDPNETIREVDKLLKQQHSDYIFGELAK